MEDLEIRMVLSETQFASLTAFLVSEANTLPVRCRDGSFPVFVKLMKCKRVLKVLKVRLLCTTSFNTWEEETFTVPHSMLESLMKSMSLF